MLEFFAKDYNGEPFVMFGLPHLVALALILLFNLSFIRIRRRADERQRKNFREIMAGILVINELGWHAWNAAVGQWTIQTMLPLHLCSLLVFLSAYMLVKRSYFIYEFAYFLGIGAAVQAILTPDLGIYGFPHFRFFQTFISHGLIVSAAVYMTVVEGYRPYKRSILRVALVGNLYMLVVTGMNVLIGSNYMFTLHKPPTASLFDVLGPWPWYLVATEGIALVMILLLYLPFALRDRRSAADQVPATN